MKSVRTHGTNCEKRGQMERVLRRTNRDTDPKCVGYWCNYFSRICEEVLEGGNLLRKGVGMMEMIKFAHGQLLGKYSVHKMVCRRR